MKLVSVITRKIVLPLCVVAACWAVLSVPHFLAEITGLSWISCLLLSVTFAGFVGVQWHEREITKSMRATTPRNESR
jgi:hypothetical protein